MEDWALLRCAVVPEIVGAGDALSMSSLSLGERGA
jgi:hypothetical protein